MRWYFLTTRSARELILLVEDFGHDVRYTIDGSTGNPRRDGLALAYLGSHGASGMIAHLKKALPGSNAHSKTCQS